MNDLAKKSISSLRWSTFNVIISTIITFASFYIIGLKLSAEAYGIKSIVFVIIGLADEFAQFGIAQAIIREKNVSNDDLDSIFWVNMILGLGAALIMITISYPISLYFGVSELFNLILISSLIYLFEPIGLVFKAILQRELNFKVLEKANILKSILTNLSLIILVYLGFGVYSFVYSLLIGIIGLTIYMFYAFIKMNMWLPSFIFRLENAKKFLNFGKYVFLKNVLNYSVRNMDIIVVSTAFGNEVLGIYSFGKDVLKKIGDLISNIFKKVSYPIFAKAKNNTLEQFRRYYLTFTKTISIIIIPISVFIIFYAGDILHLFFEEKWNAAILIVKIFSLKLVFDVISRGFATAALYAFNKPKEVLYLELFFIPLRLVFLIIASFVSVEAVAIAFLITVILKMNSSQVLLNKECNITLKSYYKQVIPYFMISTIVLTLIYIINTAFFNLNIIIIGTVFLFFYTLIVVLFDKEEIMTIKKYIFNSKKI